MKRNRGFTIIELLLVIGIIGIMAAIAIPNFTNFMRKNRIDNQMKRIYADLMNARVMAMTRNMTHFVVFNWNSDTSQYAVIADTNGNNTLDAIPTDTQLLMRSGPDRVPFSFFNIVNPNENMGNAGMAAPTTIAFNARGMATQTGTIRINVSGITPSRDCITVSPARITLGKWIGGDCVQQ
jgi:prepilin-type N-terminal cleavage/methylation domain-containing protein